MGVPPTMPQASRHARPTAVLLAVALALAGSAVCAELLTRGATGLRAGLYHGLLDGDDAGEARNERRRRLAPARVPPYPGHPVHAQPHENFHHHGEGGQLRAPWHRDADAARRLHRAYHDSAHRYAYRPATLPGCRARGYEAGGDGGQPRGNGACGVEPDWR